MRKIISLFQRNYEGNRLVRDEVVPGAEWVVNGEGIATRKYDGSCCMVEDGILFKRYDCKRGRKAPAGFIPAQEADEVTGHLPGWLQVGEGPEDRWFREAYVNSVSNAKGWTPKNGTYEAVGPHFQGNPEGFPLDILILHGITYVCDVPRTYAKLKDFFAEHNDIEGIVWHHPDGRMVKIKVKDFGIKRK